MRWLIAGSIVVALVLSVVPLPFEWRWWRPEFVALVVIYWATYSPQYFGVFSAWVSGVVLDIVELSPLGYHSLGLIVVAYISHLVYQRIRSYVLWQQAAWVFLLVGIYQMFCNWMGSFVGKNIETLAFLEAAVITAFLWPLLVMVIRTIKIHFRFP
jgi:rod shape-determining protein MreD